MGLSLTANAYLNLRGLQIDRTFFNKLLFSHPDHPSLVSVTDTFDFLGLTYKVGKVSKTEYSNLQYPLIAHVRADGQQDFEIISSKLQFEAADPELFEK